MDEQQVQTAGPQAEKMKKKESWRSIIILAVLLVVVIVVTNFVIRPVMVNQSSMSETFHDGDYVLLYQWAYTPSRGDVVVVDKGNPLGDRLFKRIIAVGGDHLEFVNGEVYINGEKTDEPYINDRRRETYTNLSLTIPENEVYVAGDNRASSVDSRSFGPISADLIMGKIVFRVFPFDGFGPVES